jgi:hypothetical protein
MWSKRTRRIALIGGVTLTILACNGEIAEVRLKIVPDTGCAPLRVEFMGEAKTKESLNPQFRWLIAPEVMLHGPHVEYTFEVPGKYDVSLLVLGESQKKTKTATIIVRNAELPHFTGLFVLHQCTYHPLKEVEEKMHVKELGRTTLEDLETKIVGRPLATSELVTHPLWRREHTYTIYTVDREQFVPLSVDRFNARGFLVVGEEVSQIALVSLPSPPAEPSPEEQVVIRLVDSWGIANVSPKSYPLKRERVADKAFRYVPAAPVTAGLYMIDLQRQDKKTSHLSPVALVHPEQ